MLEEGVDAFVHPGPLALITIHGHGEVDVADLVDHHTDEELLLAPGVGAVPVLVGIGAGAVEGDHGVFHPPHGTVYGLGRGIGVGEAVAGVDLHGVDHGLRGIAGPEGFPFLRVEGHGHDPIRGDARPILGIALRIPDEFPGAGPGEIADVLRLKAPGAFFRGPLPFLRQGLLGGDDKDRVLGRFRGLHARPLFVAHDVPRVLQDAGGGDYVICGDRDGHFVIAEFEGELPIPEEGFVVPALVIGEGCEPGVPLGEEEDVVAVLGEVLKARAASGGVGLLDVESPLDAHLRFLPRGQGLREIHPHERIPDHEGEGLALGVGDGAEVVAAGHIGHELLAA